MTYPSFEGRASGTLAIGAALLADRVVMRFSDDGVGIPEADLAQ